jgi:hypothetical protein
MRILKITFPKLTEHAFRVVSPCRVRSSARLGDKNLALSRLKRGLGGGYGPGAALAFA